jgi:hypothetical protein
MLHKKPNKQKNNNQTTTKQQQLELVLTFTEA